jgi:hypothetical protein
MLLVDDLLFYENRQNHDGLLFSLSLVAQNLNAPRPSYHSAQKDFLKRLYEPPSSPSDLPFPGSNKGRFVNLQHLENTPDKSLFSNSVKKRGFEVDLAEYLKRYQETADRIPAGSVSFNESMKMTALSLEKNLSDEFIRFIIGKKFPFFPEEFARGKTFKFSERPSHIDVTPWRGRIRDIYSTALKLLNAEMRHLAEKA